MLLRVAELKRNSKMPLVDISFDAAVVVAAAVAMVVIIIAPGT